MKTIKQFIAEKKNAAMDEKVLGVLAHIHRQKSFSPDGHKRGNWKAVDWLIDNGYVKTVSDDMVLTKKGLDALKNYKS
jgi:hypothetical protein